MQLETEQEIADMDGILWHVWDNEFEDYQDYMMHEYDIRIPDEYIRLFAHGDRFSDHVFACAARLLQG